ncbi:MAG: peptidylprolyl isomerase [Limisphaerales bacterium]
MVVASFFCFVCEPRAELVNGIEAIVDDSVITYYQVSTRNEQTYETLARDYRNQPATLEKKLDEMHNENLEFLMNRELILHEFKTAGYSLPESVLDDLVKETIRTEFGDEATLTKTLEARGLTKEKFRQQIRDRFIVNALRSKNISSEIIISPHKVEAYYLAHKDEFKVEDQVKLSVIVLKASDDPKAPDAAELAREICAKLKDGASFKEMAALYSQGSQRGQGGDWGWWEKSQLTKGLADVAYSLPVGKYSGVFSRSQGDDYWVYQYEDGQPKLARHYGVDSATRKQKLLEEKHLEDASALAALPTPQEFYLLEVDDAKPEHFKPLSEVRELIEKNLGVAEKDRLEKQWLDKIRKKTFVRTF